MFAFGDHAGDDIKAYHLRLAGRLLGRLRSYVCADIHSSTEWMCMKRAKLHTSLPKSIRRSKTQALEAYPATVVLVLKACA